MVLRRYHVILLGVALLLPGAVSYSSWEPTPYQLTRPEIGGLPQRPWIALTFDDGPHPVMTQRLMDTLKAEGVPATFFIVGKMAVRYPEIVQEMAREGYEVANHTFSHPNLARAKDQMVLNELSQTREVIQRLTGQDSLLYRPPGGNYSHRSLKVAAKAGYHMILWDVLTKDVNGTSAPVMERHILNNASDGAIVLMHSGMANTIDMLPDVIQELRTEGYHFVTVSQLLGYDRSPRGYQSPLPASSVYPIVSR
jgi:peptidoglycan/xylan/chitin deacetylase (PgdA/CDA1 family)